ncbi:TPR and SET domain containing protein [Pseudohyphozyma bogoriensis]|nr:TPR and SET domain containing protein [Pseudohyphozyma bogoriensis]
MVDFQLLREASQLSEPFPLPPPLPHELVLLAHQQAIEREQDLDRRGAVRTRTVVVGPNKHWSSKKLEELRITRIGPNSGLDCNAVAVAVKEPYIREARDGFLIRIDSPPDLIRLLPSSSLLRNITWKNSTSISTRSPTALKDDGNRSFSLKKWRPALDSYTLALDALPSGLDSVQLKLQLALLSNRAATFLKLDRPGAALRDCQRGLSSSIIDDLSSSALRQKLLYRAATASYHLQKFDSADSLLSQLLELYPLDDDALDLQRRNHLRLVEASRGWYDWGFLFAGAQRVQNLDVASYTSTAFKREAIPGRGYGLVAARDIEPGELLLVSKPLTMGVGDPTRKNFVVGANLFTETLDPYAVNDAVALLIERIQDEPDIARKVAELHPGDEMERLSITTEDQVGIDVSRLEAIVTYNAFHTESLTTKTTSSSASEDANNNIHAPSSLYHTASFLNHSCIGNISYSFLADVIFFRARLPIKEGEELVDSYVDSLEGIKRRKDKLDKHGFVCQCELCEWDRGDGEGQCERREELATELEALTDLIHGQKKPAEPHIEAMKRLVAEIDATYATSRPRLRPALYPAKRLLAQTLATMGRPEDAIALEVEALEALGAVFGSESDKEKTLVEVAKLGDLNSVMSSLFIAKQFKASWLAIAKRMEKGQAGEALFKARYGEWAAKDGLEL